MVRRRSSARRAKDDKQQAQQQQPQEEVNECIEIMETTITDHINKKNATGTSLALLLSWPVWLVSAGCRWLTLELGTVLEEKDVNFADQSTSPEDVNKFLPSVIAFIFGLVIVKNYGEYFDSVIVSLLRSWSWAISNFVELVSGISSDDVETFATILVVVLFWIGAFRVVSNLLSKLFEAPKLKSCNYSDYCDYLTMQR